MMSMKEMIYGMLEVVLDTMSDVQTFSITYGEEGKPARFTAEGRPMDVAIVLHGAVEE